DRQPHYQHGFEAACIYRPDHDGDLMMNVIANPSAAWCKQNQAYLSAQFESMRRRLSSEPAEAEEIVDMDKIGDTLRSQMQGSPAIDSLCQLFNLTSFERSLLLLCAGAEMDSQ